MENLLTSTKHPFHKMETNIDFVDPACLTPEFRNEIFFFLLSCALLVMGIYYVTYGYRHLKYSRFFVGFSMASYIVHLMCVREHVMPDYVSVLVSIGSGVLLGSITALCQYIGLYTTGFQGGIFFGIWNLTIYNILFGSGVPIPYWKVNVILIIFGIVAACLNLRYEKANAFVTGLTIFNTSIIGSGLIAISLDFFIYNLANLKWIQARLRMEAVTAPPCSCSWLMLAMWPILTILGLIIQWKFTGTGIHHQQSLAAQKRHRTPPLHRTPQQRAEMRQRKFRYLYQVRTAHGDVISQSYVQALQQKHSTPEPWHARHAGAECSTLQSDSTHLTVVASDPPNADSDEDNSTRACR